MNAKEDVVAAAGRSLYRSGAVELAEEYLTPEQYAMRMKVHKQTVLRLIREQKIPAVKVGRLWRIPVK